MSAGVRHLGHPTRDTRDKIFYTARRFCLRVALSSPSPSRRSRTCRAWQALPPVKLPAQRRGREARRTPRRACQYIARPRVRRQSHTRSLQLPTIGRSASSFPVCQFRTPAGVAAHWKDCEPGQARGGCALVRLFRSVIRFFRGFVSVAASLEQDFWCSRRGSEGGERDFWCSRRGSEGGESLGVGSVAMALSVKGLLLLLFVLCSCVSWISAQTPAPAPKPPAPPVDDDDEKGEAPEPGVEPEDEIWTWCVTDSSDKPTCDAMVRILAGLDPEKEHTHNCIVGDGDEDCMKKVQSGEAKFVILDGGEIWEANNEYGLKPIRTEVSELEGSYYGVGIVKAGKCPGSLADLKGKRSCHTGYNRATGWVFPVTYLVDNKIMPVVTTGPQSNDIESVKAFFKASCAANSDPNKEICSACHTKNACTKSDLYYDYEGAFRGLVEDACDVAFTKHTIVGQYAVGGTSAASDWTGLQDSTNYQILCPNKYNGKVCTDVANYKACNFGQAPGHAIMVAKDYPDYEINEFNNVMNAANSDPAFINLFFSGNNKEGHIFAPDATRTVTYTGTTQALLGNFYKNIQDLQSINAQKVNTGSGTRIGFSATLSLIAGLLYFLFQ